MGTTLSIRSTVNPINPRHAIAQIVPIYGGMVYNTNVNTWAVIRDAAAGTNVQGAALGPSVTVPSWVRIAHNGLALPAGVNGYNTLARTFLSFDTSWIVTVKSLLTIVSASVDFLCSGVVNQFTPTPNAGVVLQGASGFASVGPYVAADYPDADGNSLSDPLPYTSIVADGITWNSISVLVSNATALANFMSNLSIDGITRFAIRSEFDAGNAPAPAFFDGIAHNYQVSIVGARLSINFTDASSP